MHNDICHPQIHAQCQAINILRPHLPSYHPIRRYIKMKRFRSIYRTMAAVTVMAAAAAVSGCASDTGFEVNLLNVKGGHQNTLYRKSDNRDASDGHLFQEDCNPYDKSNIAETDNRDSVYERRGGYREPEARYQRQSLQVPQSAPAHPSSEGQIQMQEEQNMPHYRQIQGQDRQRLPVRTAERRPSLDFIMYEQGHRQEEQALPGRG
jgi:hypothetical protein